MYNPTVPLLGRVRLALVAVALIAAFGALAVASKPAAATNETYCYNVLVYAYQHCDQDHRHSLTANQAWSMTSGHQVCAGATLDGSFYGSYACGTTFAQHCYGGANLLVGRIHNSESYAFTMRGVLFYSEQCP